jgi:hypothetical protein
VVRQRLYDRWKNLGVPAKEISEKVEANDLPNGALVFTQSRNADFVLRTADPHRSDTATKEAPE